MQRAFDYLALYDLCGQPLGMAVTQVASGDSNHLPEQAELELDQNRRCETGGAGGSHCGHGERSCGGMGFVVRSLQEHYQNYSWSIQISHIICYCNVD